MKPTTDDVLKWAREAGYTKVDPTRDPMSILERFAALAYAAGAKAMKERAAKVCEDFDDSVTAVINVAMKNLRVSKQQKRRRM